MERGRNAAQNILDLFSVKGNKTKQKSGNIQIFSIAEGEFRGAAAQNLWGMIKPDWHAKPLSSEEEVEQVQGVFHITCRPNIKGDNIPSCVAVAAAHQLIWRTHPENWAADGRPPPGRMQHNDRVLRAHSTLGLKLGLYARSQALAFQARLQQRSPRGFHSRPFPRRQTN